MDKKKDLIYIIVILILFIVAVTFLVLSIVTKSLNNTYLCIALSATIVGNVINFIRYIKNRKNK